MNRSMPLRKYEKNDRHLVDYGYEVLEGCSFAVRGPLRPRDVDDSRGSIACLGSAATFGRHVENPYPARLAEKTGLHVINLGFGGARPDTYLKESKILDLCRQTDLVVLEFMSARSYASDLFALTSHLGKHGAISEKYVAKIPRTGSKELIGENIPVDRAYEWASENLCWAELQKIRRQLLDSYARDASSLIRHIETPVVMLWLSRRSVDATPKPGSYASWCCRFPHFVDRSVVDDITKHAIGLIDITCTIPAQSATSSQISTGVAIRHVEQSVGIDWGKGYYPSPEMHEEAAQRLAEFVSEYWNASFSI